MWRQDIAEEKQAQPQMARGCLCLSINAKQTTSLGKEDISLFISFLSLSLSLFFSGLTLILKAEGSGRGGVTQDEKDTGRGREREKERKRGADEKHLRDAGNIWFHIRDRPERKLQIDKTLMF